MSRDPRSADLLLRFMLERSGVRGAIVQLDEAWRSIAGRAEYPGPLRDLLGQTVAAAALFSASTKINGRLGIQLKGDGALRTLFAEYASGGTLRGIALWQEPLPAALSPRDFGDGALLAITIETLPPGADEPTRYQGLVGLDSDRLDHAFEAYFAASEQLPTRLLLCADGNRAAGLLIQQLPGETGDADGWARAQALFETLPADELLASDPQDLLYRLFHEDGARLLGSQPLTFACSCSRQRVGNMLLALGHEEALAAAELPDRVADIACEFCGQHYRFDLIDIEHLFSSGSVQPPTRASH